MSRSTGAGRMLTLLALTLAFALLGASSAFAIPRDAVLARGLSWVNAEVPYSQSRYWGGYRTDCSGFVSMAWGTGVSLNTRTLYRIAYPISIDDLQPGDALLKAGTHVRLFVGWADAEQTRYIAYEQTGPNAVCTVKSIDSDIAYGYVPYRYNNIWGSVPPRSVLRNPAFDAWSGNSAAWWTASRDASGTVSRRLRDPKVSPIYSLGIVNRSTSAANVAQVTQNAAVESSKTYTLDALAWTNRNPSAVRIRLQLFDAAGRTLVDTSTLGSTWGLGSGGMNRVAFSQVTPSGTTSATVSLMLAGGSYVSTDTPGYAVFDDVMLYVSSPAPVYRFYNTRSGTHFYTASAVERDNVVASMWTTYSYEGVAYEVPVSAANSQNLYRFYNTRAGTHFYTASDSERDSIIRSLGGTYSYEGVAYKVARGPSPGGSTVYRFYNPRSGTHFYTASEAERDNVIRGLGWLFSFEGPAYYVAR